jgi:hypothetical protein
MPITNYLKKNFLEYLATLIDGWRMDHENQFINLNEVVQLLEEEDVPK